MNVKMPDGTVVQNVPDGITQEDLLSRYEASKQPAAKAPLAWGDVPMEALKNTPSSAWNMAKGLASAVAHPIDTVSGLADIAAGGLRNAMPDKVRGFIDSLDPNPQAAQRATGAADAVGAGFFGGGLRGASVRERRGRVGTKLGGC